MAVHNADIAAIFYRMAELLEIEGANPFRVRAYRRAAATLEDLPQSAADLVAAGADLDALPGVGEDLAAKIREICETGRCRARVARLERLPDRAQRHGLGPAARPAAQRRAAIDRAGVRGPGGQDTPLFCSGQAGVSEDVGGP